MLKNILVISFRHMVRNKAFTIINVFGLAVSMSLAMLMLTIIHEQLSFDDFHTDRDRIFRVNSQVNHAEWGIIDFACAPLPLLFRAKGLRAGCDSSRSPAPPGVFPAEDLNRAAFPGHPRLPAALVPAERGCLRDSTFVFAPEPSFLQSANEGVSGKGLVLGARACASRRAP